MRSIAIVLAFVSIAAPAFARGGKSYSASGQVVHSRRAPVLMHKAVPPYGGVHVYEKKETSRRAERAR
jgi:hypothetical protein